MNRSEKRRSGRGGRGEAARTAREVTQFFFALTFGTVSMIERINGTKPHSTNLFAVDWPCNSDTALDFPKRMANGNIKNKCPALLRGG